MKRFGLFRIDDLCYAIPIGELRKILSDPRIYRLPQLPKGIPAVLVDSEEMVPVLDLQLLLDSEKVQPWTDRNLYQVLADSEYGTIALSAEKSGRVVTEAKGELSQPAADHEPWVTAEFAYQGEVYKVFDIDSLAMEMTKDFCRDPAESGDTRRYE